MVSAIDPRELQGSRRADQARNCDLPDCPLALFRSSMEPDQSSDLTSPVFKKRRLSPAVDRTAALPDDVIHHILSFLELKETIRTGTLSRRWRHLWLSVPIIDLGSCYSPTYSSIKNFEDIPVLINQSLSRYNSSMIQKFRAHFDYAVLTDAHLETWIKFATDRNVHEFDLNLCSRWANNYDDRKTGHYTVPLSLLECASLEVLSLASCNMNLNSPLSLRLLKKLELRHVWVSELDTSGCAVLECLILEDCNTMGHLNIHAPNQNLAYLKIDEISRVRKHDSTVTLFAPNVRSIEFGGYVRRVYTMKNLSSLKSVNLQLNSVNGSGDNYLDTLPLLKLLEYVRKVPTLIFSQWCIQVFSLWDAKETKLLPFSATTLKLQLFLNETELMGMTYVLRSAPSLESLVLQLHTGACPIPPERWDSFFYRNVADPWGLLECSLSTVPKLKTVEINNFLRSKSYLLRKKPERSLTTEKYIQKCKKEIKLAKLFLNSLTTLEKMAICTTIPTSVSLKFDFLLCLKKMLLGFPKASMDARVFLLESVENISLKVGSQKEDHSKC